MYLRAAILVVPLLLVQLSEQAGILTSRNVTRLTGPAATFERGHHTLKKRDLFSANNIQTILNTHNNLRRKEGAADMQIMSWNDELAIMANEWANGCLFEHGQPPNVSPYDPIGQNLYAIWGADLNVVDAITAWYDEKSFFNFDTLECVDGEMCGHYTQIVWSSSRQVGCAAVVCPILDYTGLDNAHYFVCNYGPAGNWWGEWPYVKGSACNMCADPTSACDNGLCTEPLPLKK